MNYPKKSAVLILSLFVSLIVGVLVYFIILMLPVLLSDTSSWTDIDAEAMRGYAITGAAIVFVLTAQKIYRQLKTEWGGDSTQDS